MTTTTGNFRKFSSILTTLLNQPVTTIQDGLLLAAALKGQKEAKFSPGKPKYKPTGQIMIKVHKFKNRLKPKEKDVLITEMSYYDPDSKYTGEKLRAIRAKRGLGSVKQNQKRAKLIKESRFNGGLIVAIDNKSQ